MGLMERHPLAKRSGPGANNTHDAEDVFRPPFLSLKPFT